MPIPILIAAVGSLCLGGLGAAAASEARDIYREAEEIVDDAKERLEEKVEELDDCKSYLSDKVDILNSLINKIDAKILPRIKNLTNEIEKRKELKIEYVNLNRQLYYALKEKNTEITVSKTFFDAVSSIATGAAVSSVTPTLLISIATSIGTASTGTAISTLSGVAAKNAALAWLGGGALSAGGAGIVGGMLTIGATTLGIGVLIGGIVLNARAEKALTQAKQYRSKVDLKIRQINGHIRKIDILGEKVEYQIFNSKRVLKIMTSYLKGISGKNMTKADVRRVMCATVIFNKYREMLTTKMVDKSLDNIVALCDKKLNEAQFLINKIKDYKGGDEQ